MALYTSQANIPQSAGTALANPGMAQFAGTEGIQAMGAQVADIGAKLQQVRDSRQMAEGIAEYNAVVDEYRNSLESKDPKDFDFVGNFDKLQPRLNKIMQGKSRAVQDELYTRMTIWNGEHKAGIQRMAIGKEVALTKEQEPDVRDMFAKRGDRAGYEAHVDSLIGTVYVERQKAVLMADYDKVFSKIAVDAEADFALGQAVNLRNPDGSIDTAAAKKLISENKNLPNEKKLDLIKQVSDWDNQEAIDNDKAWQKYQGEASQQWQEMLDQGDYRALNEAIKKYELAMPSKYQKDIADFKQKWAGIADGALKQDGQIVTDQRVRSDLYDKANSISLGTVTKRQFMDELNKARYADKTISDDDYKALSTAAAEELQKGRAQAYSEARTQAINAIVAIPDDNAFLDALNRSTAGQPVNVREMLRKTKNEERQIQFRYINTYMDELKDWLKQNPNASKSEFENYAIERRVIAQGKSIIEMRGAIESQNQKVKGEPQKYETGKSKKFVNGKEYTYQGDNVWKAE